MKSVKNGAMTGLLFILMIVIVTGTAANVSAAADPDTVVSRTVFDDASVSSEALPSSFDLRSVDTDGDGVGDRCYVTPP